MSKASSTQRSDLFAKLLILFLLVLALSNLYSLRQKIDSATAERDNISKAVKQQRQENSVLSSAIEKADDSEYLEDLAREQLGVVKPGEKVFYDVSN